MAQPLCIIFLGSEAQNSFDALKSANPTRTAFIDEFVAGLFVQIENIENQPWTQQGNRFIHHIRHNVSGILMPAPRAGTMGGIRGEGRLYQTTQVDAPKLPGYLYQHFLARGADKIATDVRIIECLTFTFFP